jgi:hypothetical protein
MKTNAVLNIISMIDEEIQLMKAKEQVIQRRFERFEKTMALGVLIAVCLFIASLSSGCSMRPIKEFNTEVKSTMTETLTLEQVRDAIIKAGSTRKWGKWTMKELEPGKLAASIVVRGKYKVAVNIYYTTTDYKITYRDSENMQHHGDWIHRKYNGWVRNLDETIKKELYGI